MTRAKAKSASKESTSMRVALELVERLYEEGKLELLTAAQRRDLLDRTIADANSFEKRMLQERVGKHRKALSC
jgi:hypothetical protein